MKDSTTGYCSCYAGLFSCTTESEESKKLRGTRAILAGYFAIWYLCIQPPTDLAFQPHSRSGCLQEFSCSSISKGSTLKSSTLALFFSSRFKSNYQRVHDRVQITYVIIQNLFFAVKSCQVERARMSQGIWLFFQPRSRNNKISLQSKNDIKQYLKWM